MTNIELINVLNWRYAVKNFDNAKKISQDNWDTLQRSMILSPSSYGLQPWKFVLIEDKNLRKELTLHSFGQNQVEDCSHFVAFCALKTITKEYIQKHIDNIAKIRQIDLSTLEGYKQVMINNLTTKTAEELFQWSSRQVYIALGMLLTSAAVLNIDACPMEGIDTMKYSEILNIPNYSVICACAIGYRGENDTYAKNAKVRFDKSEVIITK